ncbi:3-hydroxy-5-phosphonooxypentane-2,4-dione thiolase [Oscillospiraceae bacterium PP1C4]
MADAEGKKAAKTFHLDVPVSTSGFFIKGMNNTDWGLKNRLSRMFRPDSGNTVMLAFDHGYIMGATSGLERMDITVPPLTDYVDVLMATRGAIRTSISPLTDKAVCIRATHDSSVLFDDMSQGNGLALDIEEAVRMNASALAVQCFIGSKGEATSLETLCRTIDSCTKYGIPVLAVTAVGKEMERTSKYFMLATRILAELGASAVKTYYCDNFEKVVATCPVPIVIAGGKKVSESEALTMAYRAINEGASGVDMGRNIFQSENPIAMCRAIQKVVHEKYTDKQAYEFYLSLSNEPCKKE